ncbi:MAG: outer membrane lipoprotein chaperone LolA [Janthinobacterium lividum]
MLTGLSMAATLAQAATTSAATATQGGSGVQQLKAFVGLFRTARGSFTQNQVKPAGSTPSPASAVGNGNFVGGNSAGTFEFARPGKFVWAYKKPYEQLIISDGATLYVYDKDLKQVTERALGQSLAASPAAILFGSNDLEANFAVSGGGSHDGSDWAVLVPKSQDTQYKQIEIGFAGGTLRSMVLIDVFGNQTVLHFSNLEKNPSLKGDEFHFKAPADVDVVKG